MDKRVKAANEMLRELEDEGQNHRGVIGSLVGGFITILIGTILISKISKQKNG